MKNNNIKAVMIPIDELIPYENNPRNNDRAVPAVKESISRYGFLVPIVIDKDKVIINGHTRYKAAKELGLEKVPCVIADDLDEKEAQAYRLVDNKVAELATWDFAMLEMELAEIDADMEIFGFTLDIAGNPETVGNEEFDTSMFDDEQFEYLCPECGFMFND